MRGSKSVPIAIGIEERSWRFWSVGLLVAFWLFTTGFLDDSVSSGQVAAVATSLQSFSRAPASPIAKNVP
ncbi:MAG TPA: hypothetical protein DER05_03870 [Lutibacter sp.]|nr:hypothetical protein [Lutibacter sp.]